uniref:DUF1330 domain-containing protein n=1 Tax=Panagrellus redivivus TaxID=6233 RepID=A0A7E4W1Y4_PANRE
MPSIFKLETPSLADPRVRKMPLTGLYTLLLDRQFPRTFRVNLAAEIRDRASRILPRVQMYQMKYVAFPTNYLMLIYNKNKDAFVQGKEISLFMEYVNVLLILELLIYV